MSEKNVAILFDAENVSSQYAPSILAKVSSYGNVVIQRAYADWSIQNTKSWKETIARQPITAIQQFHNGESQAIDKTIIMDAIQIAIERPEINIFCIVASDKGYSSLALRLRELGKYVLGMGEETKAKEDSLLVNACNEFLYVEKIAKIDENILIESSSEMDASESREIQNYSLLKFIDQAYDMTQKTRENGVLLSQLGTSIRKIKPDFDLNTYNFSSFKQMLEAFPDDYEIYDDGKRPPTHSAIKKEHNLSEKYIKGKIKRLIHNYGIIATDEGRDYFFYNNDILPEFHNEKLEKGISVEFIVAKEPDLEAETSRERNGRAERIRIIEQSS